MHENRRELRRRRVAAGLSQTELAGRAGVSKQLVCDVEAGRAGFSPKNLKAIAEQLDCDVDDLLLPEAYDVPEGSTV